LAAAVAARRNLPTLRRPRGRPPQTRELARPQPARRSSLIRRPPEPARPLGARLGDDQEIVKDDQHGDDVAILPAETREAVRDRVAELLDAAEVDGVADATAWLVRRG
jgi:hypothetical protein